MVTMIGCWSHFSQSLDCARVTQVVIRSLADSAQFARWSTLLPSHNLWNFIELIFLSYLLRIDSDRLFCLVRHSPGYALSERGKCASEWFCVYGWAFFISFLFCYDREWSPQRKWLLLLPASMEHGGTFQLDSLKLRWLRLIECSSLWMYG